MAFISLAKELTAKGSTAVENKFITKYLPVLDAQAVKVYLFALYVSQSGSADYTLGDCARKLEMSEETVKSCFEYLEEFELVKINSYSPFEATILDADNVYGSPKKLRPEKYASFSSAVQSVIAGRMISTNEFLEYYYMLEEYSFEQSALLMIINYCVGLKGNDIKLAYIKKVAKSFADEGITTAAGVEEKLSSYTSSTPALIKIFSALGISRRPDVDDNALYEKWTKELGFSDDAVICAARHFKAKTTQKIDVAIDELYKNRKFDVKEIEDYCKQRNSLFACAGEIARSLGVYVQNAAPYVENYVGKWRDYGFEPDTLCIIAEYCFMQGRNSFERMDDYITSLYEDGVITRSAVTEKLEKLAADDKLLRSILKRCGLSRKIIEYDRQCLKRWREWDFSDEVLSRAADRARGKSNPMAYMNAVLSSWKAEGIPPADEGDALPSGGESSKAVIERHYYDLRAAAKARAEKALAKAMKDEEYAAIRKQLGSLSIKLAFAEVNDEDKAKQLSDKIAELKKRAKARLSSLGLSEDDFTPRYKCTLCNDTGYDSQGRQCECLKRFIRINKI